jgi:hypothetical protein
MSNPSIENQIAHALDILQLTSNGEDTLDFNLFGLPVTINRPE